MSDEERLKLERRSFLEQCGRFAVVTPPVVSLILAGGTKAALAASGGTSLTTKTSISTTTSITASTSITMSTSTSVTATTVPSTATATAAFLLHGPDGNESELAMVIDSMGVMKHS
jgi:hypothetical protein